MSASEIRPFTVAIPQTDIDDLHHRLAATRWPSDELVGDRTQGDHNGLPKGGHFAAWKQPEAYCDEMRTSFRSLR